MAWYYNSNSGAINEESTFWAWPELHMGVGWHGPFNSKDEAIAFYQNGKDANPGWKAPTGLLGNLKNTVGEAAGAASGAVNALDPWGNINLGNWLIRIGEIILGIVLIGVGLSKLTNIQQYIPKVIPV